MTDDQQCMLCIPGATTQSGSFSRQRLLCSSSSMTRMWYSVLLTISLHSINTPIQCNKYGFSNSRLA